MRVFMIECTAEELRANRTVMDSLTESLSRFTRAFAGIDPSKEEWLAAMAEQDDQDDIDKKIEEAGE